MSLFNRKGKIVLDEGVRRIERAIAKETKNRTFSGGAALAYNAGAVKHFGEFARINRLDPCPGGAPGGTTT